MSKFKKIKIKGLESVKKKLEEIPNKVEKKILKGAIKQASKPMLNAAKENVPVKTGALRKSLKIRAGKRKKGKVTLLIGSSNKGFANSDEYY